MAFAQVVPTVQKSGESKLRTPVETIAFSSVDPVLRQLELEHREVARARRERRRQAAACEVGRRGEPVLQRRLAGPPTCCRTVRVVGETVRM